MNPLFHMLRSGLADLLCGLLLSGCSLTQPSGGVEHVVVVWLKRPGNAADRQQVLNVSRQLREIPGLLALDAGVCLASDRPIVDSSFDVAVRMRFASKADMQAYLIHPVHQRAVKETLMPLAAKVKVFDFETLR